MSDIDAIIGVAILVAVIAFVLGPIGFFIALSASRKATQAQFLLVAANQRHHDLLERIQALERRAVEGGDAPVQDVAPALASPADVISPEIPDADISVEISTEPPPAETIAVRPASVRPASAGLNSTRPAPPRDFESFIGSRWPVWVGAVALALGGIFLVRFSIEQGYFGPAARVILGALLAIALLAAAEWLRRRERVGRLAFLPDAPIPALLSAAGCLVAFAVAYAASLFDLVAPGIAFLIMGAIALATMCLAALHGPPLAALGLLGGFAVPVLVETNSANYWALIVYLSVVTTAAYGLARIRLWQRIARAAAIGAGVWGVLLLLPGAAEDAVRVYVLVQTLLAAFFLVVDTEDATDGRPTAIDSLASVVLAGFAVLAYLANASPGTAFYPYAALAIASQLGIAFRFAAVAPAASYAGGLLTLTLAIVDEAEPSAKNVVQFFGDPFASGTLTGSINSFLSFGTAMALLVSGALGWRIWRSRGLGLIPAAIYLASAILTPLLALLVGWWRLGGFGFSPAFAAGAAILGLAFGVAVSKFTMRGTTFPAARMAIEAYAAGAIAALGLGLTMALETGGLTVALAIAAYGAAWVNSRGPIGSLAVSVGVLAVIVLARLAWNPAVMSSAGTLPVFNWLLFGYGLPAIAFWQAAVLVRASSPDRRITTLAADIALAASLLLIALLVMFEIRHWLYDGDILARRTSHVELGLQAVASIGLSAALTHFNTRSPSLVFRLGRLLAVFCGGLVAVIGLMAFQNPLFAGFEPVAGGVLFNSLLLGYAAPAIAAGLYARVLRRAGDVLLSRCVGGLALLLAFFWISLVVRHAFNPSLAQLQFPISSAEMWSYSAAWIVMGLVLLVAGFVFRLRDLRLASAPFVALTVVKVFLADMSGLQGVWRAGSFIGLGLILMGIGFLYSRFTASRSTTLD